MFARRAKAMRASRKEGRKEGRDLGRLGVGVSECFKIAK